MQQSLICQIEPESSMTVSQHTTHNRASAKNEHPKTFLSNRRHLLPGASLLRTVRVTFTAYCSRLHKGTVNHPVTKLPLRYTLKALKLPNGHSVNKKSRFVVRRRNNFFRNHHLLFFFNNVLQAISQRESS